MPAGFKITAVAMITSELGIGKTAAVYPEGDEPGRAGDQGPTEAGTNQPGIIHEPQKSSADQVAEPPHPVLPATLTTDQQVLVGQVKSFIGHIETLLDPDAAVEKDPEKRDQSSAVAERSGRDSGLLISHRSVP